MAATNRPRKYDRQLIVLLDAETASTIDDLAAKLGKPKSVLARRLLKAALADKTIRARIENLAAVE